MFWPPRWPSLLPLLSVLRLRGESSLERPRQAGIFFQSFREVSTFYDEYARSLLSYCLGTSCGSTYFLGHLPLGLEKVVPHRENCLFKISWDYLVETKAGRRPLGFLLP